MSRIETRYIVMPQHTNHYGTVFGGFIVSWIDMAAAMVAEIHCGHEAVTVSIDKVDFLVADLYRRSCPVKGEYKLCRENLHGNRGTGL